MIKKFVQSTGFLYGLFAFSMLLFISSRLIRNREEKTDRIHLSMHTFHSTAGWGYDVYTNDTLFIHQPTIPAAAGTKGFASEKEANLIGNLVINKIQSHHLPVVNLQELDSCGIGR